MRPPLYILAGGRSSRFGSDKARALMRGRPLIVGVAESLAPVTLGSTVVAARDEQYAGLGLVTVGDLRPGLGPLGGLATALADLPHRHPGEGMLLLVACDLVEPKAAWVTELCMLIGDRPAAAFRGPRGWEPVFALYRRELAQEVERRTYSDDRSLSSLLDAVGAAATAVPVGYRHVTCPGDLASV